MTFKVEFQWLSREHGDPIERATLAELAIAVDGFLATELEDLLAKTIRPTARLSAFHLAHWFATNWWRLRWEPEAGTFPWQMSHKVGASGSGYVWPDLTFCSDGSAVLVRARSTSGSPAQPLRYLSDFDVFIQASDFERGVDDFIEAVLARLASQGLYDVDLAALWKELWEERSEPDLAAWRKLEAIMGLDPDEAPDALINSLREAAVSSGIGAIEEIAAASKTKALSDLEVLLDEARPKAAPVDVADLADVRQRIDREVDPSRFPWLRAAQAASIARQVWSVGGGPVSNAKLSDLFAIAEERVQQPEDAVVVPMAAGFRDDNDGQRIHVFLKKRHPTGRRFALARLVGDHLVAAQAEQVLPATDAKTERQKFQRAFAQEFLCPFSELAEFLGSGIDDPNDELIEDAADHFQVSPLLVKTTLVNRQLMDREALGA